MAAGRRRVIWLDKCMDHFVDADSIVGSRRPPVEDTVACEGKGKLSDRVHMGTASGRKEGQHRAWHCLFVAMHAFW